MYKSNWLVVSAWSNTTKGAGSNPDSFSKKKFLFFSVFSTRVPRSIPQAFIKIFFAPISHSYYIDRPDDGQ